MGSTFRNVLSKSTQSILGFALFAIQSRYLTKEDLAIFAVAQSLIVIVSLFDFGVGVRLTTWIIETFKDQSVPTEYRRVTSSTLILSKRNQIFFVALLQSVIFGLIFLLLVRGIKIYKTGTPIATKAALLHNAYLRKMELIKDIQIIKENDKMKFVFVKIPNPYGIS